MTPAEYAQSQTLFLKLIELPEREHARLLAHAPTSIRAQVLSLLEARRAASEFLILPGDDGDETQASVETTTHSIPRMVGPYRLLQVIGEGGFGTVYLAEQEEPVRRKVAVKLIKPGMNSKEVLARFSAERQALALMNHPSIASVLDGGKTSAGAPYFVMELVKGTPIDDFCEQNHLSLDDRLKLFTQICQAVHHAHQRGIIHRDLKPSNILVTMGEQEPLAKVIDFGIAKALDSRLTDQTLFTANGQVIGSLEYMSPEQAEMSAVEIDTRSDVYSLGAVLYQLLTGTPPISKALLLKQGYFQLHKQLQQTQPPAPSSRVTANRARVSRVDRSEPITGMSELRQGDLDWIVMRALEKDRRRRYESALDFSRDILRFQKGLPVDAHPPSLAYRFAKFVGRHRMTAVAATVLICGTVLGVTGLTIGLRDANRARRQAEQSRDDMRKAQELATSQARQLSETVYPELVNSAWRAAQRFKPDAAEQWLQITAPELRGWEWKFTNVLADSRQDVIVRAANQSAVIDFDVHQTQRLVACVTEAGAVEIRSTLIDRLLQMVAGDYLASVARFSDSGDAVFVGTVQGQLMRLNTRTGESERCQQLMAGSIYDVAVSQDGSRLAVCTGGGTVRILESDSLAPIEHWKLPDRVGHLTFIDDSQRLIGSGLDGRLYDFQLGTREYSNYVLSESSLGLAIQKGNDEVVIVGSGELLAWRLDSQPSSRIRSLEHNDVLSTFCVLEDESVIVGGGDGRLVRILPDGQRQLLGLFGSAIRSIKTVKQSSRLLVSMGDGRMLMVPQMESPIWGNSIRVSGSIAGELLLRKHQLALLLEENGHLSAFDMQSGNEMIRKQAHDVGWAMSADRGGTLLATVGEDRMLRCWKLPELELKFEREIDWGVRAVCVAPDGRWVAAAPAANSDTPSGTIGIWNVSTGECEKFLRGHDNWVVSLGVSPDGKHLVSGGVNADCRLWSLADVETMQKLLLVRRSIADHFAFGPRGRQLFVGHRDGWVSSCDTATDQLAGEWAAFGDSLTGLVCTDDERLLATSRSSTELRVQDLKRGRTLAALDLGLGYVRGMTAGQDASCIGFRGIDGRFRVVSIDLSTK